jgi:transcriptional regulator GlxA family with amidase domain
VLARPPTWESLVMRIGLIVPPGLAVLSFAPLSVFEAANGVLGKSFYEVHAVSVTGGRVANSFGMELETERVTDGAFDTLLIGSPPELRPQSPELLSFLRTAPATARRIASICIGAFILGDAGLLDSRRVTTHWFYARELQRRYPKATVEMDRIFIADGQIWTSAGMTAGIDLALGLVERDIGREATRELARMLVVHHRRAGGQSQHSALLEMDATSDRVQTALQFARSNLATPLTVERLAEAARLSPRQFSRVFRAETGISPAKAIENLRLEAARFMLEQGRLPIEKIASETGFGDRERMRRSFMRAFGQGPQSVRNGSPPLASF